MNRKSILRVYIKILLIFALIYAVAGFALYLVERDCPGNEHWTIFDAYWVVAVFFSSGIEYFPKTAAGKILALSMFIVGAGGIAIVTGKVASFFIIKAKEGGEMPNNIANHYIICNWNNGGDKIIKEIHSQQADPNAEIIVITQKNVDESSLRNNPEYKDVFEIFQADVADSQYEEF